MRLAFLVTWCNTTSFQKHISRLLISIEHKQNDAIWSTECLMSKLMPNSQKYPRKISHISRNIEIPHVTATNFPSIPDKILPPVYLYLEYSDIIITKSIHQLSF